MPTVISQPTVIEAAGNRPKRIEEYVGRVNSDTAAVSVARMRSPAGWVEPGQTPAFDEYTLVSCLSSSHHFSVRYERCGEARPAGNS